MTQIEKNISDFVKRIREDEKMSQYVFVKGFSHEHISNPITKAFIAFDTIDTGVSKEFIGESVKENNKGRMYDITLRFRVYARSFDSGESLSVTANALFDSIKRSDVTNSTTEIKLTPISYDSTMRTVYRDVNVSICYCICEEASV